MGNMGIQEEIIGGFLRFAVSVLLIVGAVGVCALLWSYIKNAKHNDS